MKTETITLTDRAPVIIKGKEWPVIARGDFEDFDNQYKFQANRITEIVLLVRQHADGRTLIYAIYDYDTRFQGEKCHVAKAGILLNHSFITSAYVIDSIKKVGQQLADKVGDFEDEIHQTVDQCIADLPAEVI